MNKTLATFLSIGATVITISAFVFFVAYNMVGSETGEYKTTIEGVSENLPDGSGTTTNN